LNGNGKEDWRIRLYQSRGAGLLLYGRALGLSHAESEDVLQDTFLALLRLSAEPAAPEHYAVRSFRHRALNHRRSLWRRLVRELESSRWFERSDDETGLERVAMQVLARIPREQREVIVLKIWHGHTFEEIGALLAVSPNTAAARYRYGLEKIRSLMKDNDYERVGFTGRPDEVVETSKPLNPA
jgi:RNA polymerase sigma-70 factor (ECF subfamily)